MRQGSMVAPASFVVVLALVGAGPDAPSDEVSVLDERFGSYTAPILLLTRPDVQLDLELDPRQISGAKSTIARLIEQGLRLKKMSGPAIAAGRKAIDEEMTVWLGLNLRAGQRDRLHEIALQWEGASAIVERPLVGEYLKLTAAQRLTIANVLAQRDAQRARGFLTPAAREDFSKRALAVLSPGQRDQWDRLLGKPCRFSIGRPAGPPKSPADHRGVESPAPVGR
jgi:hypothetical protein